MAKNTKQTQSEAPEEIIKEVTKEVTPSTLPPRIHVDEFLTLYTELKGVQKAGFKAVTGKLWMRLEEWEDELKKYLKK